MEDWIKYLMAIAGVVGLAIKPTMSLVKWGNGIMSRVDRLMLLMEQLLVKDIAHSEKLSELDNRVHTLEIDMKYAKYREPL